jgi:hypothetical protein
MAELARPDVAHLQRHHYAGEYVPGRGYGAYAPSGLAHPHPVSFGQRGTDLFRVEITLQICDSGLVTLGRKRTALCGSYFVAQFERDSECLGEFRHGLCLMYIAVHQSGLEGDRYLEFTKKRYPSQGGLE